MISAAGTFGFQEQLGYRFKDAELLTEALTHSSYKATGVQNNQRLEFLGDRVLGLAISDILFQGCEKANEGQMALRYNILVCKETLAEVAEEIGLGVYLHLGRSEMHSGGRRKAALLADALEAVIAAIYLDSDFLTAKEVVVALWGERLDVTAEEARDAKSALQEWAQRNGGERPVYSEINRFGPSHAPQFTMRVTLATGESHEATADSKRQAEQFAAFELLKKVQTRE